jgi:CPA1 family monovalent cation:H+ antiporter
VALAAVILVLVTASTVVAVVAGRLNLPAPSLLVLVGLAVGLVPTIPAVRLDPTVISLVFLPPLVYAAGEELSWRDLTDVVRPLAVLAVGLVLATAGVVGLVAHAVGGLPWIQAFLLGAILSSTDPVAVNALGRHLRLPTRVATLLRAESLLNDATSLILFRITVVAAISGVIAVQATLLEFAVLAGGGIVAGVVVAGLSRIWRKFNPDPVADTVITLMTPYAAYVFAESAHASGVTAVVVGGLLSGIGRGDRQHRRDARTARSGDTAAAMLGEADEQHAVERHAVQATTVFVLESVVFGLIGWQLPALLRIEHARWVLPAVTVFVTILAIRLLVIAPLARWPITAPLARWPIVTSWAGARGVVALTAALSVPVIPSRSLVLLIAVGVIVASLVIQGLTLQPLARRAQRRRSSASE